MMTSEIQKPYTYHGGGGCSGTTPVWVLKHADGTFEARVGFALMGTTNMDEAGFEAAEHNPFHELFHDNYAVGNGASEEQALEALKADMKSIGDSLWV